MRNLIALLALTTPLAADPPSVEAVTLTQTGDTWRVDVTLLHGDTGWDDYADGWEVLDMEGNRLGYRELFHPHVNEHPFTRSLGNVAIPEGLTQVQIRARDNVGGGADEPLTTIDVPR